PEVARRMHPHNYEAILNALVRRMASEASNEAATPFAFAVYGIDRAEAETDRRIETTLDDQIRDGLLEEIAELDRRYQLVEQARRQFRMGESQERCRPGQVAITVTALALKGNLTSVRKAAPAADARCRRNAPASVLVSRA